MEAVIGHWMSLSEAAKEHGIPKTTMIDRLLGRRGTKLGRLMELSADEEELIVEQILVLGKWGLFPWRQGHSPPHQRLFRPPGKFEKGSVRKYMNSMVLFVLLSVHYLPVPVH